MLRRSEVAVRIEERVAYVEGQVSELSGRFAGIEGAIRHLETRFDARFDAVDSKFMWLIGIQITTLVAVVAALLSRPAG
jgi:hypothetical protein